MRGLFLVQCLPREEKKMALRWGICSAGRISHDFVVGLKTLPETSHKVVAVAARSLDSAQSFAATHSIPRSYGSYDELAADPEVDVVYIGTIHQTHFTCAKKMMSAGKPVLCEKPLTMNGKDTKALIEFAREKDVFLMEAIWTRCLPSVVELRHLLNDNVIGDVRYINITFGSRFQPPGTNSPMETGSVLDVGVYAINLVTMIYGEKPEKIYAQGLLTSNGCDELAAITLSYSGGRIAQLTSATAYKLSCEALISGTKGDLKLPYPFWCSQKLETVDGIKEFPFPKPYLPVNFFGSEGLGYEAEEVRKCLQDANKESAIMPLNETQIVADIMDDIMKQMGVVHRNTRIEI